jgi:exodeoxyribonuclease V alpha subunit
MTPTASTTEQPLPPGPTGLGRVRLPLVGQLVVLAARVVEAFPACTDQITLRLGTEKIAMIRLRAGISLGYVMDQGCCGLPRDELRGLTAALLEIPAELVDTTLALELAAGAVVADTVEGRACVFLAGLHRAEHGIAERLLRLLDGSPPWPAVDPE